MLNLKKKLNTKYRQLETFLVHFTLNVWYLNGTVLSKCFWSLESRYLHLFRVSPKFVLYRNEIFFRFKHFHLHVSWRPLLTQFTLLLPDPAQWSPANVFSWIQWTSRQFNLPPPRPEQWEISGTGLMALSEAEFTRKAPQVSRQRLPVLLPLGSPRKTTAASKSKRRAGTTSFARK